MNVDYLVSFSYAKLSEKTYFHLPFFSLCFSKIDVDVFSSLVIDMIANDS